MAKPTCHSCVFAYWDRGLWLRSFTLGFPIRPLCANHPDSPGRERETPPGPPCRNYRPRPADPDLTDGTVKRIPLTGGLYAYVDAADYEELSRYHWCWLSCGYAGRYEKGKRILMHRQIMNPPKGKVVDHISRNRADNTRDNLRVVTQAENCRNRGKHHGTSSRYLGVFYHKPTRKWLASISVDGKRKYLGRFDDEVEAACAYDRAAVTYFGDLSVLNFPDEWPPAKRRRVHAQAARRGELPFTRKSSPRRARRSRRTPTRVSEPTTSNHQRATSPSPRTGNRELTTDLHRRGRRGPQKKLLLQIDSDSSVPQRARRTRRKPRREPATINHQRTTSPSPRTGNRELTTDLTAGTKQIKRKNTPAARKKAKRDTNTQKKRNGPKKQR